MKKPHRNMERHHTQPASIVPPVLPLVVFEEHEDDHLLLTVNGDRSRARWVHRNEMGQTVTEVSARFATAIRVEVHQRNGSVRADILPPAPTPYPSEGASVAPDPATSPTHPSSPQLIEFSASGFLAGEEVTLSLVVEETTASAVGAARILIDRAVPPQPRSTVILRGSISGVTIAQPFA